MQKLVLAVVISLAVSPVHAQSTALDSILHDGIYRQYRIHTPPNFDASKTYELMFVLHGGTGSAMGMMQFTGFNTLSDQEDFIVVYPQGIFTGNNVVGAPGHHWADGRKTTIPDMMGIDDVGFISSLIDSLSAQLPIDLSKVYAAGISNGGYMVQRLACQLSDKLAAVATVAATFPDSLVQACSAPLPISILIINGTADNFVPTTTGGMATGAGGYVLSTDEMITLWRNNNNCSDNVSELSFPDLDSGDGSTVTQFTYDDCQGAAVIRYFKIDGGGHTWPGEVFHVPFTGNTNEDINANEEIWKFFTADPMITSLNRPMTRAKVSVYPNPMENTLKFSWSNGFQVHKFELLDIHGKSKTHLIMKTKRASNFQWKLPALKDGIYLLKMYSDNGIFVKRLIKKGN